MSDAKPEPTEEVIEDAVVVDDTEAAEPVVVETVEYAEPVAAQPQQQYVYVQTPPAPSKKGNRGVGAAIAVASGLIFTAALALVRVILDLVATGRVSLSFLAVPQFYIPVLFFVIAFVILVLLANRANWWAYILGSVAVAVVVYFGTIGLTLLAGGVIMMTPQEAAAAYALLLVNPGVVVATLLAREVSLWTGSLIARRGRAVKVRNLEARSAWERELAEKRAAHESGAAATSTTY